MLAILKLLERAELCAGRGQKKMAASMLEEVEKRYESAAIEQNDRAEQRMDMLAKVLGQPATEKPSEPQVDRQPSTNASRSVNYILTGKRVHD